jgi:electron transfer flavoprotein alpha subunit
MSGILVLADHIRGELSTLSKEMLTLAAKLGGAGVSPVRAVVIGSHMTGTAMDLNAAGVDEVIVVPVDAPEFNAGLYEAVVLDLAERYQPSLILIGHSANGIAYAAGLAVGLGAGFASDVFDVASDRSGALTATRSGFGNKVNVTLEFKGKCVTVLTIRSGTFKPSVGKGTARQLEDPCEGIQITGNWQHERFIDPTNEGVDVSKSDFILALGRGIQDEKHVPRFEQLAARLGATLACSRPVADSGWLPKSRQVGLTGKPAASCKLYVALGISGAVQHLWGMKHVETIIAVNTDANAPIFGVATYGVVGDLFAFADALENVLQQSVG